MQVLGQMQRLAYDVILKRDLAYDPATTVGALPHFRFHSLSRSARSWELLSGLARLVIERRRRTSRCVRENVRDMVASIEIRPSTGD